RKSSKKIPKSLLESDHIGNFLLHKLVKRNQLVLAAIFVKFGLDPTICDKNGINVHHLLVQKCSKNEFRFFLDSRDPNIPDQRGQTIMHLAVYRNDPSFIQMLLELGVNPNVVDRNGNTPLMISNLESRVA